MHRLIAPWLRGAAALYILAAVFLGAFHQHREATRTDDCALCTVVHTPAVVPHAAAEPSLTRSYGPTPSLVAEAAPEVEPLGPPSSRGPPPA